MIPKETIDRIFEEARIEEVVGDYVSLKRRGANMMGLCPFHNEKTPSFTVSPAKGIYKCFGCGQGGNSVNFIMEHEHSSYPEALKYLAKKYNVEIEEEELSPEMAAQVSERESQFVVSAFAEEYFMDQMLNTDEGRTIGLSYFHERGFRDDIIERFKLGYSPDRNDAFTKTAQDNGYQIDFLKKTGLTKEGKTGPYDGWRGRVMFPIHNLSGRVIGFGGRTLKKDKKVPKYVNTPECEIYHKSKSLYGIYYAKRGIVSNDNCYLVEGYTDVISLHQAGIENVVASSGTSLTADQIKLIKRYTPNITILFDGDTAGIKASFRGIDMILEEGMNVKVVLFPEGEDPDSYARKLSSTELQEYISKSSKDFIVFKTDLLRSDSEGDPVKKAGLIHDIVNSIALIPDQIARAVYVKECSNLLDIPETALLGELNKVRSKALSKKGKDFGSQPPPDQNFGGGPPPEFGGPLPMEGMPPMPGEEPKSGNQLQHQEFDIIRLLLNFSQNLLKIEEENEDGEKEEVEIPLAHYLIGELVTDEIELENPVYQRIVDEFVSHFEATDEILEVQHFIRHQETDISKMAVNMTSSRYELHSWARHQIPVGTEEQKLRKSARSAIFSYKSKRLGKMVSELESDLKDKTKSEEELLKLLKRKIKLDQVKSRLAESQGRIILK